MEVVERLMRTTRYTRADAVGSPGGKSIEGAADGGGWQLVSLHFLRERAVPPRAPAPNALTASVVEYRARLLAL
jgi:hypothetical protein